MAKITSVRGFRDILPDETPKWQRIEEKIREIFFNFGIQEIRIPVLEKTELFKRGIGEATDIVEKEMYTFLDRGNEYLTMRPEATASVIRAYIEHHIYEKGSRGKTLHHRAYVQTRKAAEGAIQTVSPDKCRISGTGGSPYRRRTYVDADVSVK